MTRLFPLFAAAACTVSPPPPPASLQPEGWADELSLAEPEDLDPDPSVLEVRLTAAPAEVEVQPGQRLPLWAFNGTVPGPLLKLKRGDRLVVHFTNALPEASSIHWHGMRVPAEMDGSELTQAAVLPGQSFTYDFTALDPGTYWYHPHLDSSAQVGLGLYGALVVEDAEEPPLGDPVTLVLSDLSVSADGGVLPGDHNGWFGDYFGREGDVRLVNGRVMPALKGRAGAPQRWRVVNASRARYWKFKIPKATVWRVGGDDGLAERPLAASEVFLVPGERGEYWVRPEVENTGPVPLWWEDSDRYHIDSLRKPEPFMKLEVVDAPRADGGSAPPESLRAIAPLDTQGARVRQVEFGEKVGPAGTAVLTIDGVTWQESMAPLMATVGETEVWEVANTTNYDHPFHLHGFQFQVLTAGNAPWPVLEWKDTVNLVAHQAVRFAVRWDDRPGRWMFHCHILDHVGLGMMAMLQLQRP